MTERLEACLLNSSTHCPAAKVKAELEAVPYVPYRGAKQQLLWILGRVNRVRKAQGLEQVPYKVVLGMRRQQVFPFGKPEGVARSSEAA